MTNNNFAKVSPAIIEELRDICGPSHVFVDEKKLEKYSRDQVPELKYAHNPEVVVMAKTADEIAAIMKLANRERIPVTPRAAGSGLSGGAVPIYGGILISIERMNQIIEIDAQNLMAVVEPGVVTNKFDKALSPYGLYFAGYPMSEEFCFVGGNVAENAGGGRAIKYGVTGRYVHGMEVVTPTGDILQLGGKRIKDVTGYDLVSLMVGSEGTLGIFTKIIIKLMPRPTERQAVLSLFADAATAISAVPEIMTGGKFIPTAIEFMDGFSFTKTAQSLKEDFPYDNIDAALLFEVDGTHADVVAENAAMIDTICREKGAIAQYAAATEPEINRLWKIRKQIPWELKRLGSHQSVEDIVVPIATIPKAVAGLKALATKYDIVIPVFGHAGDGNLHAVPTKNTDQSVTDWQATIPSLLKEIYAMTADLGGTISGEHGIGHKRRDYLELVMKPAQIDLMRQIKKVFDPNNILNPGKIFRS